MVRLIEADTKAAGAQITTLYNRGIRKSIFERIRHRVLKHNGLSQQKTTPCATTVR